MSNFAKYAAYYDLLYRDKAYGAEADYVAARILGKRPGARSLLEFGSGTGRHGRLLAAKGFEVHGIERSEEMVSIARAAAEATPSDDGHFTCEIGDIGSIDLDRSFDAVIALFHVMSYQTTNQALEAAFQSAARHLSPGGVFLFDVWHGPAVLSDPPTVRTKEIVDGRYRVKRTARPTLNPTNNTVKVTYDMQCEDRSTGETAEFSEEHVMRYLFPDEIERLTQSCGLRVKLTEEFLTGRPVSPSTWGVGYILQR